MAVDLKTLEAFLVDRRLPISASAARARFLPLVEQIKFLRDEISSLKTNPVLLRDTIAGEWVDTLTAKQRLVEELTATVEELKGAVEKLSATNAGLAKANGKLQDENQWLTSFKNNSAAEARASDRAEIASLDARLQDSLASVALLTAQNKRMALSKTRQGLIEYDQRMNAALSAQAALIGEANRALQVASESLVAGREVFSSAIGTMAHATAEIGEKSAELKSQWINLPQLPAESKPAEPKQKKERELWTITGTLRNPRQEKFCRLVSRGMSAAEAYPICGYSPNGAAQSAGKLQKKPEVAARIAKLKERAAGQP